MVFYPHLSFWTKIYICQLISLYCTICVIAWFQPLELETTDLEHLCEEVNVDIHVIANWSFISGVCVGRCLDLKDDTEWVEALDRILGTTPCTAHTQGEAAHTALPVIEMMMHISQKWALCMIAVFQCWLQNTAQWCRQMYWVSESCGIWRYLLSQGQKADNWKKYVLILRLKTLVAWILDQIDFDCGMWNHLEWMWAGIQV